MLKDVTNDLSDQCVAGLQHARYFFSGCRWDDLVLFLEDFPEPQGLVTSSRHHGLTIRGLCKLENSGSVAFELRNLGHRGVLPNYELILGVPMRGHQFFVVLGPEDLAHLGLGVDGVEASSSRGVPETNATISCTSSRCQQVGLEGAPGKSFHGCLVLVQ